MKYAMSIALALITYTTNAAEVQAETQIQAETGTQACEMLKGCNKEWFYFSDAVEKAGKVFFHADQDRDWVITQEELNANIDKLVDEWDDTYQESVKKNFAKAAGNDGKATWAKVFAVYHYNERLPYYATAVADEMSEALFTVADKDENGEISRDDLKAHFATMEKGDRWSPERSAFILQLY